MNTTCKRAWRCGTASGVLPTCSEAPCFTHDPLPSPPVSVLRSSEVGSDASGRQRHKGASTREGRVLALLLLLLSFPGPEYKVQAGSSLLCSQVESQHLERQGGTGETGRCLHCCPSTVLLSLGQSGSPSCLGSRKSILRPDKNQGKTKGDEAQGH